MKQKIDIFDFGMNDTDNKNTMIMGALSSSRSLWFSWQVTLSVVLPSIKFVLVGSRLL